MDIEKSHGPAYYSGLTVFQMRSNQQDQNALLVKKFLYQFQQELKKALRSDSLDADLKEKLQVLLAQPLRWKDIGCGDGIFTTKLLDAVTSLGLPVPKYEGIDTHDESIAHFKKTVLERYPSAVVHNQNGFNGADDAQGAYDVVSGIQSLYFVTDLDQFKQDFQRSLKPTGLGIFLQNSAVTAKAGAVLMGEKSGKYTANLPVEIFFPELSSRGWDMLLSGKDTTHIQQDAGLDPQEIKKTLVVKKLLEAMGGNPSETDMGKALAATVRERIEGTEYGPKGHYVTSSKLLIALRPDAPAILKQVVETSIRNLQKELQIGAAVS